MMFPGCISNRVQNWSSVLIPTISPLRIFCIADWLIRFSRRILVALYPDSFKVSITSILYTIMVITPSEDIIIMKPKKVKKKIIQKKTK